jgi:uncharacterized protein with FMN-binding domain
MKRSITGRVIPGLIMTAGAAVPVVTTADILSHVASSATGGTITTAQASAATAAPTATATAKQASKSTAHKRKHATKARKAAPKAKKTATSTKTKAKVSNPTTHTYTGPAVSDSYGTVQAIITVTNNRITSVKISAPGDSVRSASIASQAIPVLVQETLQAQSAQVNTVSGATTLSQAYMQSLRAALDAAHI